MRIKEISGKNLKNISTKTRRFSKESNVFRIVVAEKKITIFIGQLFICKSEWCEEYMCDATWQEYRLKYDP